MVTGEGRISISTPNQSAVSIGKVTGKFLWRLTVYQFGCRVWY
jgi:hypothetical protein